MMASPVPMRPNALKRCRPGVTSHQGRLGTRYAVVTGRAPEPIPVTLGHSIAVWQEGTKCFTEAGLT